MVTDVTIYPHNMFHECVLSVLKCSLHLKFVSCHNLFLNCWRMVVNRVNNPWHQPNFVCLEKVLFGNWSSKKILTISIEFLRNALEMIDFFFQWAKDIKWILIAETVLSIITAGNRFFPFFCNFFSALPWILKEFEAIFASA